MIPIECMCKSDSQGSSIGSTPLRKIVSRAMTCRAGRIVCEERIVHCERRADYAERLTAWLIVLYYRG